MLGRVSLLTSVAALCAATGALGGGALADRPRTFFVSPDGRDTHPGTAARPWRTVGRVNRARLSPGDRVLFRGGATYDDDTLEPPESGLPGTPITFASYGRGKANLGRGVWTDESHLVFRGLEIDGRDRVSAGIAASAEDAVRSIVIAGLAIRNVEIGILSPKRSDARWVISRNRIRRTGDSAMILLGSGFTVARNVILDAGWDPKIDYNKHGIYAKGPSMRIVGNRIAGFDANGISTRYPNARISANSISGGPIGIGYFQDSDEAGTSRIVANRIWDVDRAGIYVDGSDDESFLIANNSMSVRAGTGMHLKEVPGLTIANNLVTGSSRPVLRVERPNDTYSEHHNLWHSASGPATLVWGGRSETLSGYRALTGEGRGDKEAAPRLTTGLAPARNSPAIDAGTVIVSSELAYRRTCKRLPLHYCGAAPDMGALEYRRRRR
jgi:hypothetical protein